MMAGARPELGGGTPSMYATPLRASYMLPPLIASDRDPDRRYVLHGDGTRPQAVPLLDLPLHADPTTTLEFCSVQPRLRVLPDAPRVQQLDQPPHPQHLLPITSLALDTSTALGQAGAAGATPQGILYSAGQDGMICAWDLGLQLDADGAARHEPVFRQCVRAHNHWVSALQLYRDGQTVISGSSDCTVKAWNPHDPDTCMAPQLLGTHSDYVRSLSLAPATDWVASGSLDRHVCLWDLRQMRHDPMWRAECSHGVYAVGTNWTGSVVASGGVDHIVSGWDPRVGRRCFELIGHQDNVRTLLVSEDGRHVLSGSSDSTVRLWSVGEQRCLHTFAHHNTSVWALHSNDAQLRTFYSGDRDGWLCRVDWDPATEIRDARCAVLAQEPLHKEMPEIGSAIQTIAALDGRYVWTSCSSSASISRWDDVAPPARGTHARIPALSSLVNVGGERTLNGEDAGEYAHLLASHRTSWADEPPLEDAVRSLPPQLRDRLAFLQREAAEEATPVSRAPVRLTTPLQGFVRAQMLNNRIHAIAVDIGGVVTVWNVLHGTCLGMFAVERLLAAGREHGLRARESSYKRARAWLPQYTPGDTLELVQSLVEGQGTAPSWCSLDTTNGLLTVHMEESHLWSTELYRDDVLDDPLLPAEQAPPRAWSEAKGYVTPWVLRTLFRELITAEEHLRGTPGGPPPGVPLLLHELRSSPGTPLEEFVGAALRHIDANRDASAPSALDRMLSHVTCDAAMAPRTPAVLRSPAAPVRLGTDHESQLVKKLVCVLSALEQHMAASSTSATPTTASPPDSGTSTPASSEQGGSFLRHQLRLFSPRSRLEKRTSSSTDAVRQAPRSGAADSAPLAEHMTTFASVLTTPIHAAPPDDAGLPPLKPPAGTTLMLSPRSFMPDAQQYTFRVPTYSSALYVGLLELLLPPWLLTLLLSTPSPTKEPPRLRVVLSPWHGDGTRPTTVLPELQENERLLSASRTLRMARLATYVVQRLEQAGTKLPHPTLPPHVAKKPDRAPLQLLCKGTPLPAHCTLNQCQRYCWKDPADIQLEFRLRPDLG